MLQQRIYRLFCQRVKNSFLAGWVIVCLLISTVPAPVWAQTFNAQAGQNTTNLVSLLVEDEIYRQTELRPLILRYANDVSQAQDAEVIITILNREVSPFEIYEGLGKLFYEGTDPNVPSVLRGVILIGELPLPVVEKQGNLWPTVFPYTDFVDPVYEWDVAKERFVYRMGADMAAEIWHGVIKSPSDLMSTRVSQLKRFFEANNRLHREATLFDKKVFLADLVRQRKIVPSMLYWRYQEWIEFAEEVQYLRYTKHWLRRLYERAEQAGISSGNLSALDEYDKQVLADEILAADPGLTREEVMETLNSDGLTELPDNFAKKIIDNLAKRYVVLYENWITEANNRLFETGRWDTTDLDSLPLLVSKKDELSVLRLRDFNDRLEKALLQAVNDANVPHDVAMHHTVIVPYEEAGGGEDGGGTQYTTKPAYWNGVRPSESMTAEDCTLIRGSTRSDAFPFAQMVEANQSMDIDTVGFCKNAAEPDFNSDLYEGCCARNITYEDNEFGYNTCDLGTQWAGGQNGINSLYHIGAELPVFSERGTRELSGLQGADGCRPGFAVNEDETYAARFSSLMLHDEPRPQTLMQQVSAQFTRALPIDDPRGFSFLDHGENFHRLPFPNVFDQREAVINQNQLETVMRNLVTNKIESINDITTAGNQESNTDFNTAAGFAGQNSIWFPPQTTGQGQDGGGANNGGFGGGGGGDDECQINQSTQAIDGFTKARRWIGCGGRFSRFYETGAMIPESALEAVLSQTNWEELYEALEWIDLNIEEKNLRVFEAAMNDQDTFNQFFATTDFQGYEVVQIIGSGSTETGLEMAFLPEDFDPDFEFLEARAEEAAFVFEDGTADIEFLGENFADTFLNAQEESACDSIPNTTLTWPLRIACSLKATTTATTKQVSFGPNLGTNAPLEPQIEDLEASLEGQRLRVTPSSLFVSSQARDLIEVNVQLTDTEGNLQTGDFSSEITLEFDSSDANDFFEVSPAQTLPLVAGEITFFLVPKQREVGGRFNFRAVARNANNAGKKLQSAEIPVRIGTYRLWGKPKQRELIVGSEPGTEIEIKVLDINDTPTRDWEGETLRFESEGGVFANYGEARIKNGVATLQFLPGTKAGVYDIDVTHPGADLPPFKTNITLLPDLAVDVRLSKKSPYLIAGSFYQDVEAYLVDQFENRVDGVPHQWSWQTDNLEVRDRAAFDADPRQNGVQMLATFGRPTILPVRAVEGEETAQIEINSDFFADVTARTLDLEIIEDPVFEVRLADNRIEAGSEEFLVANIRALTQSGDLIADDFTLQVSSEPLVQGRLPSAVELIDGVGTLRFRPGTLAGDFKLRLGYPGFVTSFTDFTVLPGEPAKVDLSLPDQNLDAVSFDGNEPIDLRVQVFDKYRNLVPDWTGRINIRATEGTKHLVELDPSEFNFVRGKKTLQIRPRNLSGTVKLLAENEDLVLGTLEFKLTSFFGINDVQDLAPRSLLTLLLGWEAGDLRYKQNFATEWLVQNKTGGVATLGTDPEPAYHYGYIAPDGRIGPRLTPEWVSADYFYTLIESDRRHIAQARRSAPLSLIESPEGIVGDEPGIWWTPRTVKNKTLTFDDSDKVWRWDGFSVLELGDEGGIKILDRNFKLQPTEHLFVWEVRRHRDVLGTLTWRFEDENVQIREAFTRNGALEVDIVEPKAFALESLVGTSTNEPFGYVLLDQSRPEPQSRLLGSLGRSIEDETGINYLAWGPDWGVGSHVAAGETLGDALALNSSDTLIFYGDPSLSVVTANETSPKTGFTKDIGQPLFTSPDGRIKDLFVVDVDTDGLPDILMVEGRRLHLSRQMAPRPDGRLQFKPPERLLEVPGGIKASMLLQDDRGSAWQWVQLNINNELIVWSWENGKFSPARLEWPLSSPIESFQTATFNDDGKTDVLVVDENHSVWKWSWLGEDRWSVPENVGDFPPNFIFTDETLEEPNLNLKLGFISYDGIEQDDVLAGRTTKIKTHPDARPIQVSPDDLDEALLGSYFDPTKANPNQVSFVSLEDSSFLGRANYTTNSSSLQVEPGDIIDVELELEGTNTLDRVQLIMPQDIYFELVEDSLSCQNCGGDIEILKRSQRELFWAQFPRLQRGQRATVSWQLRVKNIPDLTVAVGDFEENFDQLDDIAIAWSEGDDPIMLYYLSSKSADENPVVKPIIDENEVVEVSDEAVESAFDDTADPDGDGIPASHDHYPETANGTESVAAGLLPGMLAGAIGGLTASLLKGGGSCFHQPMSRAQNAPGLSTNYTPPHAVPGGSSGGRCSVCLRNLRTYNMPTSTGRSASAVCLGRKRPNMASPAETDNCHVATATQTFDETCPDSGTNPDTSRLLNNASQFTSGSLNFQIPGNFDAASFNSKLQTQSGPLPGRLTDDIDKGMAWVSEQFVDLNRKTTEANPGADRVDNSPSFAGESMPNHVRPEGAVEQAQNDLEAGDTVNFTREPVPVLIPDTPAGELEAAESNFNLNREAFETELETVIPADTENFQRQLQSIVETIPDLLSTELSDLPDIEELQADFRNYQIQLRDFAADYRDFCLETPENQALDGCALAGNYMLQAQTDFNKLRSLQDVGLESLVEARTDAEASLAVLEESAPELSPVLNEYADSLTSAVEARQMLEQFVQRFTENFENTRELITSATDRVLQIREIENQVLAATTQLTEIYGQQQEAFQAKEAQTAREWAATSAVNQAQKSGEQGVRNQFYDFSLTYHTDVVDRGSLLPWKANNGISGDMPITQPPVFPQVTQEAANSTPGRMDVTLPDVQIESVEIGEINDMEEDQPPMPKVSNDLAADIETLNFRRQPIAELRNLERAITQWQELSAVLDTESLFPELNAQAEITGNFTALPTVPERLNVRNLSLLASLEPDDVPEALEPVEVPALPEVNTVPKVVQPPLDFAANLPQVPIDQKPFTPPPPATLPKVGALLAAAQPALNRMGKVGAYRIGASPVSEWYVKPHVERRTGRTSLDGNRDFTAAALEFKPYAEVAQNLVIESATGVNAMFESLGENWSNFSKSMSEALTFPNNPDLPEIDTVAPTEDVEVSYVRPTQAWQQIQKAAWQYRGLMPALATWEQWVLNTDPIEKEADKAWLLQHRQAWAQYVDTLRTAQAELEQENRLLAAIAERDKLAFWDSPQVLALVPQMGRYFTADDQTNLNFSVPDRKLRKVPLTIALPDESSFDYSYFNAPSFDQPGNNVEDLLSTGVVSNSGDGGLSDREKEDLKNAGLKPGMYYARSEATGVDVLHNVPFYGTEVQTAGDLDGDGLNEILYTLRQSTVYLKINPYLGPEALKPPRLKQLTQAEFLAAKVPLKESDTIPFWDKISLDILPFNPSDDSYYEWALRSELDGPPEIIHGTLSHPERLPGTVQPMLGRVRALSGTGQVAHLSRVPIPVETREACLNKPPFQIYYDDIIIRAGSEGATLWTYLHPLRTREARQQEWALSAGQELRLEKTDVCLLSGTATHQAIGEREFTSRTDLTVGEGLSHGSVLVLDEATTVNVELANEEQIEIEGPITYYFHEIELGELPETSQVIAFDRYMTYQQLRQLLDSQFSLWQPLVPHPGQFPWQD